MFNMHPQNIPTEDLVDFLACFYPDDVYIQELCERVDSLIESVEDTESILELYKEKQDV